MGCHLVHLLGSLLLLLFEESVLFFHLIFHFFIFISTEWLEFCFKHNLSGWLVIVHDGKPIGHPTVDHKRAHLNFCKANRI